MHTRSYIMWKKLHMVTLLMTYEEVKWQLTPIMHPLVVWRVSMSPCAVRSTQEARSSSQILFQKAWGSEVNGAPRSRTVIGILMGPRSLWKDQFSSFNEASAPSTPSTYLSSLFLTSTGSDSLPSHRKSGDQRPWSTLITCTPPRGSSLTRQMTGRAV